MSSSDQGSNPEIIRREKETVEVGAPEWMCTFADMMSLLLTFFILLFSFSTFDILKYKEALGSIKNALGIIRKAEFERIIKEVKEIKEIKRKKEKLEEYQKEDLLKDIRKAIKESGLEKDIKILKKKRGAVIRITSHIMFEEGKCELKSSAYPILEKIIEIMKKYPYTLSVEGHTDNTPIHTEIFPSNWELSLYRATNVVRFFIEKGVDPKRIYAVGYADTDPILPNTTEENKARNRRVEFVFRTAKVKELIREISLK